MPQQAVITTIKDVQKLGTILSVWAHPDDETYTCGAIMAAAVANGQQVVCVTATKGEAGVQDAKRWPPEQLVAIREQELDQALIALGITNHHWLGYRDGRCEPAPAEPAIKQLIDLIEQYQPDTILTFGPDGMTGHPDHQTVSQWVDKAVAGARQKPAIYHSIQLREIYDKYWKAADEKLNIFFNIDQPVVCEPRQCAICFKADESLLRQKYDALLAMPSQTSGMLKIFPLERCQEVFGTEAFVRAERTSQT